MVVGRQTAGRWYPRQYDNHIVRESRVRSAIPRILLSLTGESTTELRLKLHAESTWIVVARQRDLGMSIRSLEDPLL